MLLDCQKALRSLQSHCRTISEFIISLFLNTREKFLAQLADFVLYVW